MTSEAPAVGVEVLTVDSVASVTASVFEASVSSILESVLCAPLSDGACVAGAVESESYLKMPHDESINAASNADKSLNFILNPFVLSFTTIVYPK